MSYTIQMYSNSMIKVKIHVKVFIQIDKVSLRYYQRMIDYVDLTQQIGNSQKSNWTPQYIQILII